MLTDRRRGVSTSISLDTDPVMDGTGGVPGHVSFVATVDEHWHTMEYALIEGVDSAMRHDYITVAQDIELGNPGKDMDPLRKRPKFPGLDLLTQTDEEIPVGSVGDDPDQTSNEV